MAVGSAAPLVATDVIRAGDRVSAANAGSETDEGVDPANPVLGREVSRTVYAGQSLTMDNTRPARLVTRNQIVTLKYVHGGLEITVQGRAMGDAALNEPVAVFNLSSKQLVKGVVRDGGWVQAP
ncbi:MAG: flagellar basal body P-ring formation chaperone FlgA [Pseudomonadota bacterium]